MNKFCTQCGNPYPAAAVPNFCAQCGQALKVSKVITKPITTTAEQLNDPLENLGQASASIQVFGPVKRKFGDVAFEEKSNTSARQPEYSPDETMNRFKQTAKPIDLDVDSDE